MGSSLQEVFQGRGDQKRSGFWLKRAIPLVALFLTWLGLFQGVSGKFPALWFSLAFVTGAIAGILHFLAKRKEFAFEFLLAVMFIAVGVADFSGIHWLRFSYFPLLSLAAVLYPLPYVVPLSLIVPFLNLKVPPAAAILIENAAFSLSLLLTVVIFSLSVRLLRKEKEKAETALKTLEDAARDISIESGSQLPSGNTGMSDIVSTILKTDEELTEILQTICQAVIAESAHLFLPTESDFILRCSTEEKGKIIIVSGDSVLRSGLKEKKPRLFGDIQDKSIETGYTMEGRKISSIILVPVMDGTAPLGIIAADSARYQAFTERDLQTAQMFSSQIIRCFQRERLYPKLKRDLNGLNILHEESAKLLSSLDIDVIGDHICQAARKIAPSEVLFFLSKGKTFLLSNSTVKSGIDGKSVNFRGTVVQMAIDNKHTIYLRDVTDYPVPVLPMKTSGIRSVNVMPIQYEGDVLGICVMLSQKKDFLDAYQGELLRVMCNQAATSTANAKLHMEIEKLATTDGLTGLLNHRVFQEKLSAEFRRQSRFSDSTSLLLTDIDFFKKVNDTYGHPVGDIVLKGVSKILGETIRDIDIAARYGGEEFAVILPGTEAEGARIIAERLRKTVMDKTFSADGKTLQVTLSIGIATAPSDAKHKEALIEKADQALYHAKHNGRNQSVLWKSIK